jgi:hypothetical protein
MQPVCLLAVSRFSVEAPIAGVTFDTLVEGMLRHAAYWLPHALVCDEPERWNGLVL